MYTGGDSRAIGSDDRKRKQPAKDDDDDGDLSNKRLLNTRIPIPVLIDRIFHFLSLYDTMPAHGDMFDYMLFVYGNLLNPILVAIKKSDPSTSKVCCKIWNEFLAFMDKEEVSERDEILYTLHAYPIFLEWLNKNSDCRGKAIDHMIGLLENNIIKEEEENCFPWKKRNKRPMYKMPEELVCKLCPYAKLLMWLQGDEEKDDDDLSKYNLPHKVRARFIDTIWKLLSFDKIASTGGLYDVYLTLGYLKKIHDEETTKTPKKHDNTQTTSPYPIFDLEGLSVDDLQLLKCFHRRYKGIPLQVLHNYREYDNQITKSEGFYFNTYPGCFGDMSEIKPIGMFDSLFENMDFKELAELAIEKNGEGEIKFEKVVRVNLSRSWRTHSYYITFLGYCEKSPYHFKALVQEKLDVAKDVAYEVVSFNREPIELEPSGSVTITHVSEGKGTKETVSCSSRNNCEQHRKDLSLINSFIGMPEDDLLRKIQEAYRSTGAPPIKEFRQYFEQVSKSEGFHIGKYPGFFNGVTSIIKPVKWSLWFIDHIPIENLARLAIRTYNNENGNQFEFTGIKEVNVSESMHYHFYVNFFAHVGDAAPETFQALVLVNMYLLRNYEVHFCRLVHNLA